MEKHPPVLDELARGEDEFDIDLMACGCRLVAVPAPTSKEPTIQYLRDMPELDTEGLYRLISLLVERHGIDDKAFTTAVDDAISFQGGRPA